MSDELSTIAREAKTTHQALKDALKTREPWDREVDSHRKNLRRQYLLLLLAHPYSKESKDAETHLWMQTSYALIAVYKQRILALQRAVPTPQGRPGSQQQQQQQQHAGPAGVEYRRFLQRFRQFLAQEDRFWAEFVVRFCRTFALEEAQPVLTTLSITTKQDATGTVPATDATDAGDPNPSGTATHSVTSNGNSNGNPRGPPLFPPEDATAGLAPQTAAQRAARFAILSKALVCLGDIARYRELYNESGGRPKAGQEEGGLVPFRSRSSRGRRGGAAGGQTHDAPATMMARARNYDRAQSCYEQARLLVPSEGNASHQLAILASYKKDLFGSLGFYYRALCVRQPYDTASENLGTVLSKALEQWRARAKKKAKEGDQDAAIPLVPWRRGEILKDKEVVLHALWRLGVEKMDAISPKHAQDIRDEFYSLVSEKHVPPDFICRMMFPPQGALWKHRMIREPTPSGSPKDSGDDPIPGPSSKAVEARMLTHLLAMQQVLLEVGIIELADSSTEDGTENGLAQRITATFRRTLPALRISSKWLQANYRYLVHPRSFDDSGIAKTRENRGSLSTAAAAGAEVNAAILQYWTKYAKFSTLLWRTFPLEGLPALSMPLEEDVDMTGFLPLTQTNGDAKNADAADQKDAVSGLPSMISSGEGQVHPNVEQLMRISDLLNDAKVLADTEDSLIRFTGSEFILKSSGFGGIKKHTQNHRSSRLLSGTEFFTARHERDEEALTESSRPEEDPVQLAFGASLDVVDDNDEIVYPRTSAVPAPIAIPTMLPTSSSRPSPITPIKPNLSPIGTSARSPTSPTGPTPFASPRTSATATTAQDLLINMYSTRLPRTSLGLSGNGDSYSSQTVESSAPQPQLLFGSGPPNRPDHSIWSTSLDGQSIKYPGANAGLGTSGHIGGSSGNSSYHSPQQPQIFPSTEFAHSIWSSVYPVNPTSTSATQASSSPFALPLHTPTSSIGTTSLTTHQRTLSSSSTSLAQLFTAQHQKRSSDDPLLYSSSLLPGSTRQQQQPQQHQPQPAMRPIGTQPFSTSFGPSYSGSATRDSDQGMGMQYGHALPRDYHGNGQPHHQPRMSHALAGTPLSSTWGNT